MVGDAATVAGHPNGYAALSYNIPGGGLGDWSIGLHGSMPV